MTQLGQVSRLLVASGLPHIFVSTYILSGMFLKVGLSGAPYA